MFYKFIWRNKIFFERNGFTLIEIIITISIFLAIMFFVSALTNDIFLNSSRSLLSMDNIDQARIISSAFANEIRNATIGNNGSYPLNKADQFEIIFYSNFGSENPLVSNRIRYYISDNNLYKGTIIPSGNPLTYNLSSESVRIIQSDLQNEETPLFYYYSGEYDGSSEALQDPVNINDVRFIKINLMILNRNFEDDSGVFSVSSGAVIRSVKSNLGN
jgi:prepilin-type N-terminal cleavage/methylation domain-containing protein